MESLVFETLCKVCGKIIKKEEQLNFSQARDVERASKFCPASTNCLSAREAKGSTGLAYLHGSIADLADIDDERKIQNVAHLLVFY